MTVTTYSKYINVGYSPFIQIYDLNTLIAHVYVHLAEHIRQKTWERLENYTYRPAAKPGEQSSLPAGAESFFYATCMQTSYTVIWVLFQAANKATSTTASTQQTSKTNTVELYIYIVKVSAATNKKQTNRSIEQNINWYLYSSWNATDLLS